MIIIQDEWQNNLVQFNDVTLLLTDPPYGFNLAEWDVLNVAWLKHAYERGNDNLRVICFTGSRNYHKVAWEAERQGFIIYDPIAYLTPASYAQSAGLKRRHDLIMVASKNPLRVDSSKEEVGIIGDGKPKFPSQDYADNNRKMDLKRGDPKNRTEWRHAGTAIADSCISPDYDKFVLIKKARENKHLAEKNSVLADWLVNLFGVKGAKSLDPFAGSGALAKACEKFGMLAIGIEKNYETNL